VTGNWSLRPSWDYQLAPVCAGGPKRVLRLDPSAISAAPREIKGIGGREWFPRMRFCSHELGVAGSFSVFRVFAG
jgi:hypothetical protein